MASQGYYRIGKVETPIVSRSLRKKRQISESKWSLPRSFMSGVVATVLWSDLLFGKSYEIWMTATGQILYCVEVCFAVLFTINAAACLLHYLISLLTGMPIELTYIQRHLLGITDDDPGFKAKTLQVPPASSNVKITDPWLHSSTLASDGSRLSPPTSPYQWQHHASFSSPYSVTASPYSPSSSYSPITGSPDSPISHQQSPIFYSQYNSACRRHPSSSISTPYTSNEYAPTYSPGSMISSYYSPGRRSPYGGPSNVPLLKRSPELKRSPGVSIPRSYSTSPHTSFMSRSHYQFSPDNIREAMNKHKPRFYSNGIGHSFNLDNSITNVDDLNVFLEEEKAKEDMLQRSMNLSSTSNRTFWNSQSSDYSPLLGQLQYQVSSREPHGQTSHKDEDSSHPSTYSEGEVWSKLQITQQMLTCWEENLRNWICQTILVRLVDEISSINDSLHRIGCSEIKIGSVSLSSLKQVCLTKGVHIRTLSAMLPYLEVTANQDYLVYRIRELASGGCISAYCWNGGGSYKGKRWDEHLPTDAAIVMHMFCSYMDSRLPPHPKYPDGKTFTSQYFLKVPDKPSTTGKDRLHIYQTCINPPRYKVIINDGKWDVPKGRNNLFHAILLFLYHVREREGGMLGRANLGLSGVNILRVLEY